MQPCEDLSMQRDHASILAVLQSDSRLIVTAWWIRHMSKSCLKQLPWWYVSRSWGLEISPTRHNPLRTQGVNDHTSLYVLNYSASAELDLTNNDQSTLISLIRWHLIRFTLNRSTNQCTNVKSCFEHSLETIYVINAADYRNGKDGRQRGFKQNSVQTYVQSTMIKSTNQHCLRTLSSWAVTSRAALTHKSKLIACHLLVK